DLVTGVQTCALPISLDLLPISGRIVIGAGDDAKVLRVDENVGAGGEEVDLALDPLEGRGVVARGGYGAMSMIAVGERGSLMALRSEERRGGKGGGWG